MFARATKSLAVIVGAFAVGAGSASLAQSLTPTKLPVQLFAKYDEFGRVRISPDGQTIALATAKKGRAALSIINLQDNKIYGNLGNDKHEFGDFDWVSNTRLVYTLSEYDDEPTIPRGKGELLAIDRDMNQHAMIYGYRVKDTKPGPGEIPVLGQPNQAVATIISTLPRDDRNILIAEQKWRKEEKWFRADLDAKPVLTLLDVNTGLKQNLGSIPVGGIEILLDKEAQPRFAIGPGDKSNPAFAWKPNAKGPWTVISLPGFRTGSVRPQLISDDDAVIITAAAERESYVGLFRFNPANGQSEKIFAFPNADIVSLVFDFSGRKIVGAIGYLDKPVYQWFDANDPAAKLYAALQRAFPGLYVTVHDTSEDGTRAIVLAWSDTNPGDVHLFDSQKATAQFLYSLRPGVDKKQMRPKEAFSFKARDGMQLRGYLTRPAGEGPFPLVVFPHDGPGTRDYFGFDPQVQLLANRGYAVLQLNFRGSSGFGIDFEAAGDKEWGAKIQDDLTDATRWALEQKLSTPDRVCIYGIGLGAYAALIGAEREPKLYKCAIGEAGVYDLELLASKGNSLKSRNDRDHLERALGTDKEQLRSRSPVNNVQRIDIPVLLLYGNEPWHKDIEHAKRMRTALEKNHKSYESFALARDGVGMYDEDARREVYERVLAFLDKHLMSGTPQPPTTPASIKRPVD